MIRVSRVRVPPHARRRARLRRPSILAEGAGRQFPGLGDRVLWPGARQGDLDEPRLTQGGRVGVTPLDELGQRGLLVDQRQPLTLDPLHLDGVVAGGDQIGLSALEKPSLELLEERVALRLDLSDR